jgi:mannose/fructose/N-acetylgalactosamine-specific phosphotransferase system component IIC
MEGIAVILGLFLFFVPAILSWVLLRREKHLYSYLIATIELTFFILLSFAGTGGHGYPSELLPSVVGISVLGSILAVVTLLAARQKPSYPFAALLLYLTQVFFLTILLYYEYAASAAKWKERMRRIEHEKQQSTEP